METTDYSEQKKSQISDRRLKQLRKEESMLLDHARQILYSILVNQENTMQSFLCTMIRDISLVRHLTSESL